MVRENEWLCCCFDLRSEQAVASCKSCESCSADAAFQCRPTLPDPPAGLKKGRLAEDAGGVWSHALNYGAKLAVMGVAVFLLLEYPDMPGVLQSLCLSEQPLGPGWWRALGVGGCI